jgi:hypothetical protein
MTHRLHSIRQGLLCSGWLSLLALALIALGPTAACAQQAPRWVWSDEDAGTVDLETGLVWSFPTMAVDQYLYDLGIHDNVGWVYNQEGAAYMPLFCNNDGTGFCTYPEFSNEFFFGTDVEKYHEDWRLPTRDELVEACQAGIVEYLDASPEDGFQYFGDGYVYYDTVWSSTTHTRGRWTQGYEVNIYTGEAILTSVDSGRANSLLVRGKPPAEEPTKPGNGNGRKK